MSNVMIKVIYQYRGPIKCLLNSAFLVFKKSGCCLFGLVKTMLSESISEIVFMIQGHLQGQMS